MDRFIQIHNDNKRPPNFDNYMNYPILPLKMALESFLSQIDKLAHYIVVAECLCRHVSAYNLTRDESAALYLYAEEWGEQSLHHALNRALRSGNEFMVEPWYGFLKLFNAALEKLPTAKRTVWRGVHIDIVKNFQENEEITWWGVNSCSTAASMIKCLLNKHLVLCSIDALNGKDICGFTHWSTENEVLLFPGTRLRVKSKKLDNSTGQQQIVYLEEISNDNHERPTTPIHNSISSANKSSEHDSSSARFKKTFVSTAHMPTNNSFSDKDESKSNIELSIITFSNGDRYEKTYKKGDKHGYAKFYKNNGQIHEGCFADIRAKGTGIRTWSNGDRYEGTFDYGKMHGYGMLSCGNGYAYVGSWSADEHHGKGTSTWPNGNHYEGYYKEGKIHGVGTFCSANGDKYEGNLVDGKAHGQGERIWSDGDRYKGNFKDDKKQGYGVYSYPNSAKYTGDWANDEMNGEGLFIWSSGSWYKGTFKNGKRHGRGKLTFADGKIEEGLWENDIFVS